MATLRESLVHEPNELKFGTSGLRALVTDMTDLECYINAAGFLRFLVERRELKPDGVVLLAGDLRDSTPRIMRAVAAAIRDGGYKIENCGLVPTPTISLYGFSRGVPSIMVTGSHIPADRNGIKFIKPHDEVLKGDEPSVTANVSAVRVEMYGLDVNEAQFDSSGMLKHEMVLPAETLAARELYTKRYVEVFGAKALAGKQLVFYQHSAVGRDYLADLFEQLGAEVVRVGRSDVFIPIDSENVTDQDEAYFKKLATDNSEAFAIVSTDGDSDRPFVIDAQGEFHRGDVLGAVVAEWLKADFAAFPVSTIDAVDKRLTSEGVIWKHTKIGSPYVISCMKEAIETGKSRAVGWEVNGGFLLGSDLEVGGKIL
ncbi:MAG TPA: phosphomannomutase, partial [Candidatus Saccharimonadia bacterium]|nr:phosphomannomutase [Candidatus Saccharimonadia bacterium]